MITATQDRQLIHPAVPLSMSSPLFNDILIIIPHSQAATIQPDKYIIIGRGFPAIIFKKFEFSK